MSTEHPLLCISTHCRTPERGGPRRTQRAWFCPDCIEQARDQLRRVAEAWPDLEDALVRSEVAAGEPVSGTRDPGLVLNERASEARARATADVWAYARIVLDWADDNERTVHVPASTVPELARWVGDWHLPVFTVHAGRYSALAFIDGVWDMWRDVRGAAYPSGGRKVPTGLTCTEHATTAEGERAPCAGTMHAWVSPQATTLPDLVCSEDDTHRIDPATWQRAGWKRAATNAEGIARLIERMDS